MISLFIPVIGKCFTTYFNCFKKEFSNMLILLSRGSRLDFEGKNKHACYKGT
jgi:hypothetical protein